MLFSQGKRKQIITDIRYDQMYNNYAYVTLLTSDSYLPGALVLCKSLKATHSKYPLVILVTPETVSNSCLDILQKYFDVILSVSPIRSGQSRELELLGRIDLDITWTKLHAWNPQILPFDRIVFLDADVLILENVDSLFDYVNESYFAAAPDVGWPDCFNSGVFVTKPNTDLYEKLIHHSQTVASFDGGDQGLLNSFFSSWSGHLTVENANAVKSTRLPFVYNVTPTAFYSYLPAFVHFSPTIMAVHFIGETKPWLWERFVDGGIIPKASVSLETLQMIRKWWNVFDEYHLYKPLWNLPTNERWINYKLPIQATSGNFVPNPTYFESKTESKDSINQYKVKWNPKEVAIPRSLSPDKKSQQRMDRSSSSRGGVSRESRESNQKSLEFSEYKVAWNEQETKPPRERSKSPKKEPNPYHKFERSISSHSLKVAANPPVDLKDYKISWDEKEVKTSLGSQTPLSLSPDLKEALLLQNATTPLADSIPTSLNLYPTSPKKEK